jgi:hypothetical protein
VDDVVVIDCPSAENSAVPTVSSGIGSPSLAQCRWRSARSARHPMNP